MDQTTCRLTVNRLIQKRLKGLRRVNREVQRHHIVPSAVEKRNLAPPVRAGKRCRVCPLEIVGHRVCRQPRFQERRTDEFHREGMQIRPVKGGKIICHRCKPRGTMHRKQTFPPMQRDAVQIPTAAAICRFAVRHSFLAKFSL